MALDIALQKINKFITLNSKDRAEYANDFNFIRDTIIGKMRSLDPIFDKLYNGSCLGGSYADNLKVHKPDEFDLVLRLKLRESQLISIKKVPKLPGYCKINLTESMKKIKPELQNSDIFSHIEKLITADGYLIQDKVLSWIESLMSKVINELNDGKISSNDKVYKLKYTKAGPAHTINVEQGENKFSIDFVPAFIFDKTKWNAERELPTNAPNQAKNWIAVPKPIKEAETPNLSFICSYVDAERVLIADKNSLKNTCKMLKKLRDRRKLNNLKSYFIKTVYLWENEIQPSSFWNKRTAEVLLHMTDKLIGYLEKENLPFFWDSSQNLLGNLTSHQISNIRNEIKNAHKILTNNMDKVYDVFLTAEEQQMLPNSPKLGGRTLDVVDGVDAVPKNKSELKIFLIKKILKKFEGNNVKIISTIKQIINEETDLHEVTRKLDILQL